MSESPLIYTQMSKILCDADGLAKEQQNKQQGFKFRGVDDAYNYLHDIFKKHQVFSVPRVMKTTREERLSKSGGVLIYTILDVEYDFFAVDGSKITAYVIGESMDSGDKSCSKSLSIAHRNALFQITMLPSTLSIDPDNETYEPMPKPVEEKPPSEIALAIREQHAQLSEYRAMQNTTKEMNDYIDSQGSHLTYKQADQLIKRIKELKDAPPLGDK